MAKEPESISYIKIGDVSHPIDAVTLNGRTLPDSWDGLPSVTNENNGKILMVLQGQWSLFSPSDLYSSINGIPCGDIGDSESETPIPPHDYTYDYLTLEIITPGTLKWNEIGSDSSKTIEYSINDGEWSSITSSSDGVSLNVSEGDSVRLRGTNSAYATSNKNYSGFGGGTGVTGTAKFNVSGNIMSLIYGDNFVNQTTLQTAYAFCCLFDGSNAVSAENLILPATTLSQHCYRALFANCNYFTTAPVLPATTLAASCYRYMFNMDALMTTAPELPAETVPDSAYYGMFNGCSSLNYIKCLATNISAHYATQSWVTGVANTGTFVKDGSMNLWPENSSNGIPVGWTVINSGDVVISVNDPLISCVDNYVYITCDTENATIYYRLGTSGNYQVYTTPIEISEDTHVEAYASLNDVSSNVTICDCEYYSEPDIPIPDDGDSDSDSDIGESEVPVHDYSLDYLTFDILTGGTILWDSEGSGATKTIEYSKNDGEWTSVTSTGSGVAINVVAGDSLRFRGSNTQYCNANKSNYSRFGAGTATFNVSGNIMSMTAGDNFANVTTLPGSWTFTQFFKESKPVSAENLILPATTMTECCYRALFSKCSTLEVAPALPATTLANDCYWYMFEDCSISTAPDLLSETLVKECYGYMFKGCSNLNYIKCLANAGFSSSNCLQNWVSGVAATGTFVKDANTSWSTGASAIPTGWVVYDGEFIEDPVITFNNENKITITCETEGADIYYRLNQEGNYTLYTGVITINDDVIIEAYASKDGQQSNTISQSCTYAEHVYRFNDLQFASGVLYYGNNGYEIKDSYNYNSYNTTYGKTVGSTYFSFIEMGELFENSGFTSSDGNIENILDPFNGWRLPSKSEWESIIGVTRSGSTVNNSSNKHYAKITVSDTIVYQGNTDINLIGMLIFPDNETITGTTLANIDNSYSNSLTLSQLNEYLNQGCVFLPHYGQYQNGNGWMNSIGDYCGYWSSSEYESSNASAYHFEEGGSAGVTPTNKLTYLPVYLVKNMSYGGEAPFTAATQDLNTNWVI